MYIGILIAIIFTLHSVVSQDLYVSPHDIKLTIHETKNFSVYLKEPVEDAVYLNYSFSSDNIPVVNLSTPDLVIPGNSKNALIFTLHPVEAGKTTVLIDGNTTTGIDIDTTNAFVRVSVIYVYSLEVFSAVVGWIYFVAWSVSFYPQAYSNFKRKSVVGLNFDFLALNITGFLAYSFFNLGLYFSPIVQEEYLSNHRGGVIPVEINDVVFGVHAAFASLLQIIQCFIYERDDQRVSNTAKAILSLVWGAGVIFLIVTWTGVNKYEPWLTFLYYFSYCKLGITIIKYIPQAYFNFRRKSTVGWSIGNIILDFTGGLLSMMQMFAIAYNYNDWESLFGNPTKFGLGFFSILFDILFMIQHYCLYRRHNKERDPLCESATT